MSAGRPSAGRQVLAVVAKDLLVEWRTHDLLATMIVLGVTTLVLFNFAVDYGRVPFSAAGASAPWLAFTFTAATGLARSFALERENRCLEGLLVAPVDRSVLYAGKLLVNFLVLSVLGAMLLFGALLLLNQGAGRVTLHGGSLLRLLGVLELATVGFAAVGTLFALMAQMTRRGLVVLPVLQSIFTLPVLTAGVIATARILDPDAPGADLAAPVRLLAAFDVAVVCLALVVFEHVVED